MFILISFIAMSGNSLFTSLADNQTTDSSAIIIASKCYVYYEKDFSKKIEIDGKAVYLNHGDNVTILEEEGDFALIDCDNIEFEGNKYVYKYYLSQNKAQNIYPVFNGKLRRNAMLYDNDLKEKVILKKNTRVFIYEGFKKGEYTAIQVLLDDNAPYFGYIKTENIKPDGINGLLIAGISIIVAAVTIILSLVFIKKKNNKKKQKQYV